MGMFDSWDHFIYSFNCGLTKGIDIGIRYLPEIDSASNGTFNGLSA